MIDIRLHLLAPDKGLHRWIGAAIGCVAALLAMKFGHGLVLPSHASLVASSAIGAGKELADWLANRRARAAGQPEPHGVEAADWLATTEGGALVALPLMAAGL